MESRLPWGGAALVWIEETTDAVIKLAGSVVCSCTSANVSSGWSSSDWGSSCGWGGDGACCIWASREEGDDSIGIGDLGGGGGVAVLWRFACDLVLLEPFLFGWLDWGASAVVLLVFADLLVCWYNNESFMSTRVTGYWWGSDWNNKSYWWSSHASRCVLKNCVNVRMELV